MASGDTNYTPAGYYSPANASIGSQGYTQGKSSGSSGTTAPGNKSLSGDSSNLSPIGSSKNGGVIFQDTKTGAQVTLQQVGSAQGGGLYYSPATKTTTFIPDAQKQSGTQSGYLNPSTGQTIRQDRNLGVPNGLTNLNNSTTQSQRIPLSGGTGNYEPNLVATTGMAGFGSQNGSKPRFEVVSRSRDVVNTDTGAVVNFNGIKGQGILTTRNTVTEKFVKTPEGSLYALPKNSAKAEQFVNRLSAAGEKGIVSANTVQRISLALGLGGTVAQEFKDEKLFTNSNQVNYVYGANGKIVDTVINNPTTPYGVTSNGSVSDIQKLRGNAPVAINQALNTESQSTKYFSDLKENNLNPSVVLTPVEKAGRDAEVTFIKVPVAPTYEESQRKPNGYLAEVSPEFLEENRKYGIAEANVNKDSEFFNPDTGEKVELDKSKVLVNVKNFEGLRMVRANKEQIAEAKAKEQTTFNARTGYPITEFIDTELKNTAKAVEETYGKGAASIINPVSEFLTYVPATAVKAVEDIGVGVKFAVKNPTSFLPNPSNAVKEGREKVVLSIYENVAPLAAFAAIQPAKEAATGVKVIESVAPTLAQKAGSIAAPFIKGAGVGGFFGAFSAESIDKQRYLNKPLFSESSANVEGGAVGAAVGGTFQYLGERSVANENIKAQAHFLKDKADYAAIRNSPLPVDQAAFERLAPAEVKAKAEELRAKGTFVGSDIYNEYLGYRTSGGTKEAVFPVSANLKTPTAETNIIQGANVLENPESNLPNGKAIKAYAELQERLGVSPKNSVVPKLTETRILIEEPEKPPRLDDNRKLLDEFYKTKAFVRGVDEAGNVVNTVVEPYYVKGEVIPKKAFSNLATLEGSRTSSIFGTQESLGKIEFRKVPYGSIPYDAPKVSGGFLERGGGGNFQSIDNPNNKGSYVTFGRERLSAAQLKASIEQNLRGSKVYRAIEGLRFFGRNSDVSGINKLVRSPISGDLVSVPGGNGKGASVPVSVSFPDIVDTPEAIRRARSGGSDTSVLSLSQGVEQTSGTRQVSTSRVRFYSTASPSATDLGNVRPSVPKSTQPFVVKNVNDFADIILNAPKRSSEIANSKVSKGILLEVPSEGKQSVEIKAKSKPINYEPPVVESRPVVKVPENQAGDSRVAETNEGQKQTTKSIEKLSEKEKGELLGAFQQRIMASGFNGNNVRVPINAPSNYYSKFTGLGAIFGANGFNQGKQVQVISNEVSKGIRLSASSPSQVQVGFKPIDINKVNFGGSGIPSRQPIQISEPPITKEKLIERTQSGLRQTYADSFDFSRTSNQGSRVIPQEKTIVKDRVEPISRIGIKDRTQQIDRIQSTERTQILERTQLIDRLNGSPRYDRVFDRVTTGGGLGGGGGGGGGGGEGRGGYGFINKAKKAATGLFPDPISVSRAQRASGKFVYGVPSTAAIKRSSLYKKTAGALRPTSFQINSRNKFRGLR